MEEHVGKLWHRAITGAARRDHPEAAVRLEEVERAVGVMFRALGGDSGLRVEPAADSAHGARRRWLERIAGSGRRIALAWRDDETLRLPALLAAYPNRELNRRLYLWLAALAAIDDDGDDRWLQRSQAATRRALARYPGLASSYRRLVDAELARRPDPATLPPAEAAWERAIRCALQNPGTVAEPPPAKRPPRPVSLWLHPSPPVPRPGAPAGDGGDDAAQPAAPASKAERRRRRAERVAMPENDRGLLAARWENIFSWAEFVNVDRGHDEDDDPDTARKAADDLDVLSVARDNRPAASRLRFDLDLPSAANDDTPLGEGILLPEWDYRRAVLHPDHCSLQTMVAANAGSCTLPRRLHRSARRLRRQFETLAPARVWQRGLTEGSEIDIDACLAHAARRAAGHIDEEPRLYRGVRAGDRDLACLLLADLSMSTDAWINNDARVIDVIRDALYLFGESLSATGDHFAMYGFSSRRRQHVRLNLLKGFDEAYGGRVRGRLAEMKPGYYTRMGAAIRQATRLLAGQSAQRRLLLLLTDGKPNDLDQYEGRYGVEDTRAAIAEARRAGLHPFCVTIDELAADYLPHIFGSGGYVVIREAAQLPRKLPALYARLTRR